MSFTVTFLENGCKYPEYVNSEVVATDLENGSAPPSPSKDRVGYLAFCKSQGYQLLEDEPVNQSTKKASKLTPDAVKVIANKVGNEAYIRMSGKVSEFFNSEGKGLREGLI